MRMLVLVLHTFLPLQRKSANESQRITSRRGRECGGVATPIWLFFQSFPRKRDALWGIFSTTGRFSKRGLSNRPIFTFGVCFWFTDSWHLAKKFHLGIVRPLCQSVSIGCPHFQRCPREPNVTVRQGLASYLISNVMVAQLDS